MCHGVGNGTPLQYSCLENPMDGGAWWAAVHGAAKSQTRMSDFTFTFHCHALEKEWQPTPVFLPGESQGREASWAAVYEVAQSWTQLKRLSRTTCLPVFSIFSNLLWHICFNFEKALFSMIGVLFKSIYNSNAFLKLTFLIQKCMLYLFIFKCFFSSLVELDCLIHVGIKNIYVDWSI